MIFYRINVNQDKVLAYMGKLWAIRGDGNNSPATFVTEELILSIQSLCRAEVLKTAGY